MNKQLQRALERLVEGNSQTAVEELEHFVKEVKALTAAGELSREDADSLLEEARKLIGQLKTTDLRS